jgi:hypothetical protein
MEIRLLQTRCSVIMLCTPRIQCLSSTIFNRDSSINHSKHSEHSMVPNAPWVTRCVLRPYYVRASLEKRSIPHQCCHMFPSPSKIHSNFSSLTASLSETKTVWYGWWPFQTAAYPTQTNVYTHTRTRVWELGFLVFWSSQTEQPTINSDRIDIRNRN